MITDKIVGSNAMLDSVLKEIDSLRMDVNTTWKQVQILDALRQRITDEPFPERYFKIFSLGIKESIGKCSYDAVADVRMENPQVKFIEISKEEFLADEE